MTPARRRIAVAALAAGCVVNLSGCGDSDTTVERPSSKDKQELVRQLDAAYDAQGVCYGWQFTPRDGDDGFGDPPVTNIGSNFGTGRTIDETKCDRAVEVQIRVTYTSMSSEAEDYASLTVETYGNLPDSLRFDIDSALENRFGLTEQVLIDNPVGSLGTAVLALPLLVAEAGEAPPVPPPTIAAGQVEPLREGNSDFWRSHGGVVLTALVMLVAASLLGYGGWKSRLRELEREARRRSRSARAQKARVRD